MSLSTYSNISFVASLGDWRREKWAQDLQFKMHDPTWRLTKSSIFGVKFDRPKFDELSKALKRKICRLPAGEYIDMYCNGILFIGNLPAHLSPSQVCYTNGNYREDVTKPQAPVRPTMLVKTRGSYNKASSDLLDAYNQDVLEFVARMEVYNSYPSRPPGESSAPPYIVLSPASPEAHYIQKIGGMLAEGIEAVLSPELKGEAQLRKLCCASAPAIDLQEIWTVLKSMHTGNNERAYEDLLNRMEALNC